jgi:restriction endonuclease S subunit
MATGTFATIILKKLNEIPVSIPNNTDEQQAISIVLSNLDNLITLHQRK